MSTSAERLGRSKPLLKKQKVSDEAILETAHLSESEAAVRLGIARQNIGRRRAVLGVTREMPNQMAKTAAVEQRLQERVGRHHSARAELQIDSGTVLIGSDCHYQPGDPAAAHRAFVRFCRTLKPAAVILNGDVIDAATISRFPDIGWETKPTLEQEIATAQTRLREIRKAAPQARYIWTLGNHDMRFETRLASVAPQFARIHGVHLRDHFPDWEPAWSVWINGGDVVVKHRFRGGIHATYNNTVKAGTTIVTGHLHSLQVTRFSDYRGHRWGIDGGTMAAPYQRPFVDYTEDNPVDWASGFAVLTFDNGRLLWPEVAHVIDEEKGFVSFRGRVTEV